MSLSDTLKIKQSISVFWGLSILLVIIGMFYLGLHGFFNENIAEFFVFGITIMMLTVSIVLTQFNIFFLENNVTQSAQSFWIGFLAWFGIASAGSTGSGAITSALDSITIKSSILFSTISGQIPADWNFFLNNVVNPIVEEAFFAVALPLFIIGILEGLSKTSPVLRPLKNPALQVVILLLTIPVAFAVFHVGKFVYTFIIAAIMFRMIFISLLWGDLKFNIIPFVIILPSFLVGSHMGNNFGTQGIGEALNFLFTSTPGLMTLGVFIIFAFAALAKPLAIFARMNG